MKLVKPNGIHFTTIVFVMALVACIGGVLISIAATLLSMPILAWISLYSGLLGFSVLISMFIMIVVGEISTLSRNRQGTPVQPER